MLLRIAFLTIAGAASVAAQSFTASLEGTVKDSTGAVIPDAAIVALNVANNSRTTGRSDAAGHFTVLQLSPGTYTVQATAAGFKKYVRDGIVLEVQQPADVEI